MAVISCSFYKGYYFFIVYWLAEIIRSALDILLNKSKALEIPKDKEDFSIEEELFNLVLLNISDLLTGILVLYTKIAMKPLRKNEERKKDKKKNILKSSLIYNDITNKSHKFSLIFLISILDFVAKSAYFYSALIKIQRLKCRQIDMVLLIDIMARIFFSIIFLKIKIRNHHKLSIELCMIGFILLSISDIITIKKENMKINDIILFIIIIFPKAILFPLEDVLNKILLIDEFMLPHSLIFWRGVTQLGFLFILIPILYFNHKINFEYLNEIKNIKKISFSILFTFISSIRTICLMNVIYNFDSYYVSFLLVIKIFDNTIRQFFENDIIYNFKDIKGIMHFIIDILSLLILAFGTLIFNEMLVINVCGLNKKTKQGLLIMEKIENIDNLDSYYFTEEDDNVKENKSEKRNQSIQSSSNNSSNNNIYIFDKENESKEESF